ncbi:hypothetical protein ACOTIX_01790, partial [Achromobacter xylosoxidans]
YSPGGRRAGRAPPTVRFVPAQGARGALVKLCRNIVGEVANRAMRTVVDSYSQDIVSYRRGATL